MADKYVRDKIRPARIPDEIWEPAKAVAKERGDSLAQIWRDGLVEYVEKYGPVTPPPR